MSQVVSSETGRLHDVTPSEVRHEEAAGSRFGLE